VGKELHDDGTYSDKVFAPGYGEFFTAHGGEVEALALAVPTDAIKGSPPTDLEALSRVSHDVIGAVGSGDWKSASAGSRKAARAWAAYRTGHVPRRLEAEMNRALKALSSALEQRDRPRAGSAAIDVAHPRSTFSCSTARRPRSTSAASRSGRTRCSSMRLRATSAQCAAMWRRWNGSGTGSRTGSTPPI
jgi:hypothetical protein